MLEIKEAKIEDAEKIYDMLKADGWGHFSEEVVEGLIRTSYAISLELLINDKIIGGLGAIPEDDECATLHYIVVHKDYRKNGYASRLMNKFFDEAKSRGIKKIALDTLDKNYFEKFGFKEIGRLPCWEDKRDKVIMLKEFE